MPGRASRTAPTRDDAVAGAVGVVIMLALALAFAAHEARSSLPREGLEAERAWSAELEETAREAAAALADGRPTSIPIAAAPQPPGFRLPQGQRLAGPATTGMASLAPECAGFRALHVANGTTVLDANATSRGCLELRIDPVYGRAVAYVVELGGVVRVQPEGAVVVSGPPLAFDRAASGAYRVSLTLATLEQAAEMRPLVTWTPVELDLVPLRQAREENSGPSAESATWTFTTRYPAAWRDWYAVRIATANWSSAASAVCMPADCALDAHGRGTVVVEFTGDSSTARDIDLALTQILVRASLR